MAIRFHPHAKERMLERGAFEEEVRATIENGECYPAKYGRTGFRRNFSTNQERRGRVYATKQVEVYAIQEQADWLVITVLTRFF
jgi:hypothetical protein